LDAYDIDEIDDEEYERMDPAERARAEAEMARRDAERARAAGRIPEAFMDGMFYRTLDTCFKDTKMKGRQREP
jgi:hypothetical protein